MSAITVTDWMRPLGPTGLTVSAVTLGGSPLGSMPGLYGTDVAPVQAIDLVRYTLDTAVRTIDTSNGYSDGESELRIGAAHGGLPDDVTVITKVDPSGRDYSADRVRRSIAESRERLGLDVLPLVHLHDPENFDFDEIAGPGGAVDALVALRESGAIGSIGIAGGPAPEMARYVDLGVFDVLLVHNRWTLVDRSAEALIANASARGMGVINAALFGGGILADPTRASYGYRPVAPETRRAVDALTGLCERFGTDLRTAALQWSFRDPRIATTVVGTTRTAAVDDAIAAFDRRLPADFWDEAATLVPPAEVWVDAGR